MRGEIRVAGGWMEECDDGPASAGGGKIGGNCIKSRLWAGEPSLHMLGFRQLSKSWIVLASGSYIQTRKRRERKKEKGFWVEGFESWVKGKGNGSGDLKPLCVEMGGVQGMVFGPKPRYKTSCTVAAGRCFRELVHGLAQQ